MNKRFPVPKSETTRVQLKLIDGEMVPSHYIDGRMNYCCGKCGGRLDIGRFKNTMGLYCTSCGKFFHFGLWGENWVGRMAFRMYYEISTA
jgi:hypothetical protein